jgi:leader peptidase (prepilin peptidase)/N-methyltransferase
LWAQQALNLPVAALVAELVATDDARIRAAAVRVLPVGDSLAPLTKLVADANPRVRLEAVRALGKLGAARAAELALTVLETLVFALPPGTSALHALMVYVAHFALALALVAAAFIDVEHMIIPDAVSLGGALLGLATSPLRDMAWLDSLLGAAAGFAMVWLPFDFLYRKLRGKTGMGLGDAKLMMLAGAWLGGSGAAFVLGAAAMQGTLATLVMLLSGQRIEEPEAVRREREELREELAKLSEEDRAALLLELAEDPLAEPPEEGLGKARIAFGPFLILAILECLFIGRERLLGWILVG